MPQTTLQMLENIFQDEEILVLGEFRHSIELNLGDQYSMALDAAFQIYPFTTFWCSDNPTKYSDILKNTAANITRYFEPVNKSLGAKIPTIMYVPVPIWVMPPEDVETWLLEAKESGCPVGWGSLSLAVGLSYRLGFKKITAIGCRSRGSADLKWNLETQTFDDSPYNENDYNKSIEVAIDMAEMLKIDLSFQGD